MKRYSLNNAILLTLPCAFFLLAALGISRWQENVRKARTAFYSHPFKPQLLLGRGRVPDYASPGLFEVTARCKATGARGQSQWLLRGTLVTVGRTTSRAIWNSQKVLEPGMISHVSSGSYSFSLGRTAAKGLGPSNESTFSWRFDRHMNRNAQKLRFFVEAVAIPTPVTEDDLGSHGIKVQEATPSQIVAAREQPGAKYFRESFELNAQDDSKYHFSRDAMSL